MHLGYHCISLQIGKLYIFRDLLFDETTLPFATFSNIDFSESNTSFGILGSASQQINSSPLNLVTIDLFSHSPFQSAPTYPTNSSSTSDTSHPLSLPHTISLINSNAPIQPPSPESTPPPKTKSLTTIYNQTKPILSRTSKHLLLACLLQRNHPFSSPLASSKLQKIRCGPRP